MAKKIYCNTYNFLAYVSSASGENNDDDHEQIAKQIFGDPMTSLLASGVARCSNDLFNCRSTVRKYSKFIDDQRDTIHEQATLIKFMNEGLKHLCGIIDSIYASNDIDKFCDFVNNGTIDHLGELYDKIDHMHYEL